MHELKTLKDIEEEFPTADWYEINPFYNRQREEAIKHVKNWRVLGGKDFNKNPHRGEMYAFISFFNITEEELD